MDILIMIVLPCLAFAWLAVGVHREWRKVDDLETKIIEMTERMIRDGK